MFLPTGKSVVCGAALAVACVLGAFSAQILQAGELVVHKRARVSEADKGFQVKATEEKWQTANTAIIVCDMWDSHHCLNAVRRETELAPRMNEVLKTARKAGVLIIHAPSSCMGPYENHPGRKIAQSAKPASKLPAEIEKWCYKIPSEEQGIYPIDQTDGGEDDDAAEHAEWHKRLAAIGRNPKAPWKKQIDLLEIMEGDAISDSGVEIWNLLEERGIQNVILCGVHTNMCVLGRPFGLRQMSKNGKNVVLMRDMTDTMYNPARPPYVNHFMGTELIVEHVEKYVCPTILSTDIVGGKPFRFSGDLRKVVMVIGDDEYKTEVTLPKFAAEQLAPLGLDITIIEAEKHNRNSFPGLAEAVKDADLVVLSARRRVASPADIAALKAHVAAGKPLVGIRTASHAFSIRLEDERKKLLAEGYADWPELDKDVLGGNYHNHHGGDVKTAISVLTGEDQGILRGIKTEALVGNGSLYLTSPLAPTARAILMGEVPEKMKEPVAWTNLAGPKKARVFYTSLGHIDDFANPEFVKLLRGGVVWCLTPDYSGVHVDTPK